MPPLLLCLTFLTPSVDVLRRPLASPVIVTHSPRPAMESGCAGLQAGHARQPHRTVVTHTRVIRESAGDLCPAQLSVRGQTCRWGMNAPKIAGGSLREEGGEIELECAGLDTRSPDQGRHAAVCTLRSPCRFPPQHRFLLSPGRWRRRCRCSCYTALDSTAPQAAEPSSPHYDSFMASQPAQGEPAPERQEDEQPPHEHSVDESRKHRILGKAADVATDTADAAIEILTSLLP